MNYYLFSRSLILLRNYCPSNMPYILPFSSSPLQKRAHNHLNLEGLLGTHDPVMSSRQGNKFAYLVACQSIPKLLKGKGNAFSSLP